MPGQLAFILDVLDACLAHAGLDRDGLLSVTSFTTDLPELGRSLPAFREWGITVPL